MATTFEPADARRDRAVLTELNVAYLGWLDMNIQHAFGLDLPTLLGQPIADYVAATLDKLCAATPPEGVFYLVRRDGEVGATIVRRLIADAALFGYASMRLDSGPFMTSAHRLYEAEGFRDRPICDGAEVPSELHHDWRLMERSLPCRTHESMHAVVPIPNGFRSRTPLSDQALPSIVACLAHRPDQLVLQSELLRDVWGPQYGDEGNDLRVFIAQIRKKLEPTPERPRYFITEPGIGDRLEHTFTEGANQ